MAQSLQRHNAAAVARLGQQVADKSLTAYFTGHREAQTALHAARSELSAQLAASVHAIKLQETQEATLKGREQHHAEIRKAWGALVKAYNDIGASIAHRFALCREHFGDERADHVREIGLIAIDAEDKPLASRTAFEQRVADADAAGRLAVDTFKSRAHVLRQPLSRTLIPSRLYDACFSATHSPMLGRLSCVRL